MFTRPRITPARPSHLRATSTEELAALSARSTADLHQLLNTFNNRLPAPIQAPAQASTLPAAHTPAWEPVPAKQTTQGVWRQITQLKAALLVLAIGFGALIAFAVITSLVASGHSERTANATTKLASTVSALSTQQAELEASTATALKRMQDSVTEIKYPPNEYLEAVNAFREGRYMEAENGFRAYTLKYPQGKVVDKALLNAAVSAGMRGQCSQVDGYLATLVRRQPKVRGRDFAAIEIEAAIRDAKAVAATCRQLRAARTQ